jgi:hypothetical protein
MTGNPPGSDESLTEALARIAGPDPALTPFALGWATVELDRAERDLIDGLDGSVDGARDLADDILLGARCRILPAARPGDPSIVLLEPFTEGRLAATLARHGEGPAAVWLRTDPSALATPARRSTPAEGPFGLEVLLLDGAVSGPHRLIVLAGAGTITP